MDLIRQLEDEINESKIYRNYCTNSKEVTDRKRDEANRHIMDIWKHERDLIEARKSSQDGNQLIGIVWASSGTQGGVERKYPKVDRVEKVGMDWAVIKLFPEVKNGLENLVSLNPLRPLQERQLFTEAKPWRNPWSKFRVFKRGRTTDYTIGEVNSSPVVGVYDGIEYPIFAFSIVFTSVNGSFALLGDSGSWIMDKGGHLVGMVWGQNTTTKDTLFIPTDYLFDWIQTKFERAQGMQLKGTAYERGRRVKIFRSATTLPMELGAQLPN